MGISASERLPTRESVVREAQTPLPINGKCVCVVSPCNCDASSVQSKAIRAVASKGSMPKEDEKPAEKSILEKAADEIGELTEAAIDTGKKLFNSATNAVVKPIAEGTANATKGVFEGIKDSASNFLGGLNDTIRYGIIAIALALAAALVLGILFLRR